MNTRRRFMRWFPTLPLVGPLAVKAGAAMQSAPVQKAAAVPELLFRNGEASSPYWLRVNGGLWRLDLWLPPNVLQRYSEQIGGHLRWAGSTSERFSVAVGPTAQRIANELWSVVGPLAKMAS